MEVSSPVDVLRLRAEIDTVTRVQFQVPLSEADYRTLAAILAEHPSVTLRVYGFDAELATLRFLRWFPHLRRLSVAGLFHLTDLTPLHQLDADVEFLDLGETRKPLDLTPATVFRGLRELRIASHRRGLADLLHTNPNLQGLAMWRLPVDQILPVVTLPHLQSLSLTLGSLTEAEWLTQIPTLRYLALRDVRQLTNLEPVTRLTALQWLILHALTIDQLPDFSGSTALLRVDLNGMRRIRQPNFLDGLAAAPRLQDLRVTQSSLPVEAFTPFTSHPTLAHVGVGLSSERRNRAAEHLLGRTPPRHDDHFAATHDLLYIL
ncbi:hypothetical protein ABZ754_23515 [Micromonospora purpureochromogenes]|uniref:hypothetical protein n=1 Tax=Micromonospora purpureochromogenes TaxID=47872 RepID=UPI0033D960DC